MRFLLLLSLLCVWKAEGRVFDLKKEKFGTYLLFSSSQSNLKDTPFIGESTANDYSDTYTNITGGEFGFLYSKPSLGFRFGFEVIKPGPMEGDAKLSSNRLYRYKNDITVMAPKLAVEINFKTGTWYRISGYGFYGNASYASKTDFSQITITPSTDHTVEQKSSAAIMGGGMAIEMSAFDTTTFVVEAGYRQLKFVNVIYSKDVTTYNGTYFSGDAVTNADGSSHQVDFTGAYAVVGLRFYLF